jgi:uncharacterized glyoxalase superfamily protein PhnB
MSNAPSGSGRAERAQPESFRGRTLGASLTVKGLDRAKGEGFSLQITTAQDVDALAARIKERGATLATEPADVWGARVFRLQDPDGFRWVVSSERK